MIKYRKKLALHVGIIISIMFLITNVATVIMTIVGTRNMYLESNNERIIRDINGFKRLYMNPDLLSYVVDTWENDIDLIKRPYTAEEKQLREDAGFTERLGYNLSRKSLEEMDPEMRATYIKLLYDNAADNFDKEYQKKSFDRLYCMDIHQDASCFVIMECSEFTNDTDHGIGKEFYADPAIYKQVRNILSGEHKAKGPDEVLFEQIYRPDSGNYLYVAYAPVYIDGKLKFVMCEEYNWTKFSVILRKNMRGIIWFTVVSVILMDTILVILIYLNAVRPIGKVNDGVRAYMENKDSKAAVSKMKEITARNEIGVLAESFSELVEEIDRYTGDIKKLTGEKQRVAIELSLAAKIQSDVLPKVFPDKPEFRLFAYMQPAKEVGGDFYDFFDIDEDHMGLVIADVSDKGVPAALFMMMSKMLIKNYARTGISPAEVLKKTNISICENNKNMMFVTVWFGILDIRTGHVTAVNAGHEYPMVRHSGGNFEMFEDMHGFVLGMAATAKYREYGFDMEKGSTLFLYTDGASEARDKEEQFFGTDGILEALNIEPDAEPEKLLENINTAIDGFVKDAPRFDDLTMLCIKYYGQVDER